VAAEIPAREGPSGAPCDVASDERENAAGLIAPGPEEAFGPVDLFCAKRQAVRDRLAPEPVFSTPTMMGPRLRRQTRAHVYGRKAPACRAGSSAAPATLLGRRRAGRPAEHKNPARPPYGP